MMPIGIKWSFMLNDMLNQLHASTHFKESDIQSQSLALISAVTLIEASEKYSAKPIAPPPAKAKEGFVTVHFSLIFKKQRDMHAYIKSRQMLE